MSITNPSSAQAPQAGAVIEFPDGLPGFEQHRRFVILSGQAFDPFTILQGMGPDAPSFATVDPRRFVPGYEPAPGGSDLSRLHADASTPLLWLAIVCVDAGGSATANLRAPVVINPAALRGVQVMDISVADDHRTAPAYRFDHPLRVA